MDWSSDGRQILVRRDSLLEIVAIDGSAAPRQIVRPGQLWEGHFSPDGHAVAYSSDETGRAEVYVQKLPSGPAIRISQEGGRWPTWSNAGRRLSFVTPGGRVQEVEAGADPGRPAGTPRTRFSIPTWAPQHLRR